MQGWVDQHPVLFGIVLGLFVLIVVSFVMSWWSGWALLARKFRARDGFTGTRHWNQSGTMRWFAGYRGVLIMGANSEGLYLAAVPFFPMFHPPLFIPWSEIYVLDGSSVVFGHVDLELGNDLRLPIEISGPHTDDLRKAAGPSWPGGLGSQHPNRN